MVAAEGGVEPSADPKQWNTSCEIANSDNQQLHWQSDARETAVAEAVAAVAHSGGHEYGSSHFEALNLMLPRAASAALGSRSESGSIRIKLGSQAQSEGSAIAGTHAVLHGYEALRAMRARAHEFRKGYHNWRRHQAHGARGDVHDVFAEDASTATQHVIPWSHNAASSLESTGILMRASSTNGSDNAARGIILTAPGAAPPPSALAEVEALSRGHSMEKMELEPKWLRFFFNPHTPLLSAGVWPLRRDFLPHISQKATVPQYPVDSTAVKCWIAHIGVGGFHRSHQCVFYDDLLTKTALGLLPDDLPEGVDRGPWAVCGVGILPSDKRMCDILHDQEFLYTVLTRSQRICEARVVGSLMDFVFAPEEPMRLRGLLVDLRTKLLSLTITEKGYCMATDGNLDRESRGVKSDLTIAKANKTTWQGVETPQTAIGLIYMGLALRRAAGIRPFTVLSCDNIPNNGKLLKRMVVQFATEVDVEMATWISKHVCFPCTMVDRITPMTGSEHIALLEEDYGVGDKWPVVAEDFKQWVIGDTFCNDRPFFEAVGCLVVREVQSYEEMKLKLLNAGHSCIAYISTLLGYRYVDEAIRDVRISGFLRSYMDEATPCLKDLKVDIERYKERVVERFGNAFVKDELQRVAQDGSSKFYSTTRSSICQLLEQHKGVAKISLALAAWIVYFATDQVDGIKIEPSDPKTNVLRGFACEALRQPFCVSPVASFLHTVYGLPDALASVLTRWVTMAVAALSQRGVAETLDVGGPLEALLEACFHKEPSWMRFVEFSGQRGGARRLLSESSGIPGQPVDDKQEHYYTDKESADTDRLQEHNEAA
ncbi:mannitol 2-dehydrogenase [Cyclospora cayetanensis]|uniref:Mannitol 2-dehydrogenase n=1 Tax=Cyclospora cayetanensis TaxID=88456 RepID=A0A6P6S051_9EIME|nr:mannitol 2-dehydrogenase [Cyclospora cayetanensis]